MTSLWTNKADKVVDLYHICNLLDDHFLFRFRFRVRFRVRFRFRFRPFPLNPLALKIEWIYMRRKVTGPDSLELASPGNEKESMNEK